LRSFLFIKYFSKNGVSIKAQWEKAAQEKKFERAQQCALSLFIRKAFLF
tara:strand:+ start:486111 stop:486257 length:147 start_codon:yes stop_codon:yes gene_type:complete